MCSHAWLNASIQFMHTVDQLGMNSVPGCNIINNKQLLVYTNMFTL